MHFAPVMQPSHKRERLCFRWEATAAASWLGAQTPIFCIEPVCKRQNAPCLDQTQRPSSPGWSTTHTQGFIVNKYALFASAGALLLATQVFAQEDAGLEKFRTAYTSTKGLTYVVIPGDKGEKVYRYGDASREAAKKDKRGFMLFTCASPRVFVSDSVSDREALGKAKVVQAGDPGFAELDAKYLAGCRNPFVKSAIPPKTGK
jgi:hypothetical protein